MIMEQIISVIIPAYNAEKYIGESIESVLSQGIDDLEIIVVNDGSKDNTETIVRKLREKNTNIRLINQENSGVSVARNNGIKNATGKWITFLDADDAIQKGSLKKIVDMNLDADIILGNYSSDRLLENNKDIVQEKLDAKVLKKAILNYPKYHYLCSNGFKLDGFNNWTCWGKLFKREWLIKNQIMFEKGITHGEDLLFDYKAYSCTERIIGIDIDMYYYRTNNESVSRSYNPKRIDNTKKIFERLLEFESSLEEDSDFQHFVIDRLIACCSLYYMNKKNASSMKEKKEDLKHLCQVRYIHKAIQEGETESLSVGRKRNIIMKMIYWQLKHDWYGNALRLAKIM